MSTHARRLLLALSGDIHLKSRRTRRRLERVLGHNLRAALDSATDRVEIQTGPAGRWSIVPCDSAVDLESVAQRASRVFGIYRVELVREIRAQPLDALVADAARHSQAGVAGRTFAVRARSRGSRRGDSMDIARALGDRLLSTSAGVDLDDPEVAVRIQAWPELAFIEQDRLGGGDGLPIGSQSPVLGLLSGGFDSPVAAWMLMRRGAPVDFVHFRMECAQSEHAAAVAHELWQRWGAGSRPDLWHIDFQEIRQHLLDRVDTRDRQVVLKHLMVATAERLALDTGHAALLTGDSVGQVSSQTLANLAQIDAGRDLPVLRPLAGFTKEEIIDRAHRIGTGNLSARAREVCDLAHGPVETAATRRTLQRAAEQLPDDLVDRAVATRRRIHVPSWLPGEPGLPDRTA